MCFCFNYHAKYPKSSAARFTEFTSPVLFDTIATTRSPHNCTLYLLWTNGYVDIPTWCVFVCVCVSVHMSHDSVEYICELLLKVTSGQANLESK